MRCLSLGEFNGALVVVSFGLPVDEQKGELAVYVYTPPDRQLSSNGLVLNQSFTDGLD